jgi:hypothetical protein
MYIRYASLWYAYSTHQGRTCTKLIPQQEPTPAPGRRRPTALSQVQVFHSRNAALRLLKECEHTYYARNVTGHKCVLTAVNR